MSRRKLTELPVKSQEILGDPNDPLAFCNIIPDKFLTALNKVEPHLFLIDDKDLYKDIPKHRQAKLSRLRNSFWQEYHRCRYRKLKMNLSNVLAPVMGHMGLMYILERPIELAYLISPIPEYSNAIQESLTLAVDEMRKILEADMTDPKTGGLCPKIADVKRRLFVDLADRVHGMPIQHIEQKNLNLNQNVDTLEQSKPRTVEEIDAKIRELENQGREVIEASVEKPEVD